MEVDEIVTIKKEPEEYLVNVINAMLQYQQQQQLLQRQSLQRAAQQPSTSAHCFDTPTETFVPNVPSYLNNKPDFMHHTEPVMNTDLGSLSTHPPTQIPDVYKPRISLPQYADMVFSQGSSPPISPPQNNTTGEPFEFTRDTMRQYLRKRKSLDKEVIIKHAKVAQKSYKNEKRFFCPPPCVYLRGDSWHVGDRRMGTSDALTPHAFIGISRNSEESHQLNLEEKGFAAAKNLYISDSVDKRKQFNLHCQMLYTSGQSIGTLKSKGIKVISKPSKKKLSVKNIALSIGSGSKVALFNRLRSQTVSTRFLHVEENKFHASSNQWGSFAIHLGVAMPRCVIRKVEKQVAILDAEDPVSQLHKVAFYFKDTDRMYLCLSQDRIIQFKATPCPNDPNKEMINDGACWTVISTDEAKYKFCEMGPSKTLVTPVPTVTQVSAEGHQQDKSENCLHLIGENFTPKLDVWLEDYKCKTIYRCEELLVAQIPAVQVFRPDWTFVEDKLECLISLVRKDGVVYATDQHYVYAVEHPTPPSPPDNEPNVIT